MSKQPLSDLHDDELPPPYTRTAPEHGMFASHLRGIHSQVQSSESSDSYTLATLIDPIESFLATVSSLRPKPRLIEGAFIPAEALGPDWTLTDEGDKHKGEVTKVVRVKRDTKGASHEKGSKASEEQGSGSREKEFSDWGRYDDEVSSNPDAEVALWWCDEDLAHRLARQLQPTSSQASASHPQEADMDVRAEEITFRRENEMGIWESKTGWGIVVRLSLRH